MTKRIVFVLMLAVVITACSKKADEATEAAEKMAQDARNKIENLVGEDPPQNIEEAMKRVGDAMSNGEQSASVENLKALLPKELAGLKRTSYEAERTGLGIKVSKANAEYGDGDQRLSLMITDLGGASALARMGRELFEVEIDSENENGFERTTTYKGHKSFQRMQRSGDQSISEMMVFVDERFTVQLDGQNVSYEQLTKGMDEIDLDALLALSTAAKK